MNLRLCHRICKHWRQNRLHGQFCRQCVRGLTGSFTSLLCDE